MKFITIWTMPAMSMHERMSRTREWAAQKAARALPSRIRYWVAIQQIAHATIDSPNVPATTVDALLPKLEGCPK